MSMILLIAYLLKLQPTIKVVSIKNIAKDVDTIT